MTEMTISAVTAQALGLLGGLVAEGRRAKGWTESSLAERLGVSRGTVARIEDGHPSVRVGTVLEAATLVGVPLFGDEVDRARERARVDARLALLPSSVRDRRPDDDF